MHATCIGVNGESAAENIVPVISGVTIDAELVSLNLSTMAWMYTL